MTEQALMPRVTVYEMEADRARALDLYAKAYDALEEAVAAHGRAEVSGRSARPTVAFGSYGDACHYGGPAKRGEFLTRARQELDRGCWTHLIGATKLESLMDNQARDEFRKQLADDPPEATAENCLAFMERFREDAGMIFRRGVAKAFAGLDRRFRSHDGFKIGSRMVLTHAFNEGGSWSDWNRRETLRDVERAFYLLDGKPNPDQAAGIVGAIDLAKQGAGYRRFVGVVESDYFKVRTFGNGNAHVWFKRDDILERVNLLLAEYYGAALGAGTDAADKHTRSTAVAKNMGFFASPEAVASRVLSECGVHTKSTFHGEPPLYDVLEPSAGEGGLAAPAARAGHRVTCVELHPGRAVSLRASGLYPKVVQGDFLEMNPDQLGRFDKIVMNPPFDRGLDIDHVRHAFRFLKPGGTLTAIMSAGTEFREDKRTEAFRAWAEPLRGQRYNRLFSDLPDGSFKESGTMVNAVTVTLYAPRAA